MSEENLAATRRFFDAFNDRDIDRMAADIHPEGEFYPLRAQLEHKAYIGREGLDEMFADFDEDWEHLRLAVDELRDRDDQVFVRARLQARGLTSGIDLDVPIGFVLRFADGQLVYSRSYSEPDDAMHAAGLE